MILLQKRKRNSTAKSADSPTVQTPDVNDNLRSPKRPRTDGDDLRFSSQLLHFYLYGQNSKFPQPLKGKKQDKNVL